MFMYMYVPWGGCLFVLLVVLSMPSPKESVLSC